MLRTDVATNTAVMPDIPALGTPGYFTDGDPGSGTPATRPGAFWFNMIQEEIMAVLTEGGITPDKEELTQLRDAILAMIAANTSGNSVLFMNRYAPVWASTTTVQIPSGFRCRDKNNSHDIVFGSAQTVSISSSGANGLDTGAVGPSARYYLHAIDDSTGANTPKGLLSLSRTAPVLPAGYDKSRPIPVVYYTNASSQIKKNFHGGGFPNSPIWMYDDYLEPYTSSTNRVINGGSATSLTVYDASAYVPPESDLAFGLYAQKGTLGILKLSNSASGSGQGESHIDETRMHRVLPLTSAQQGYYSISTGNAYLAIAGFRITKEFDS